MLNYCEHQNFIALASVGRINREESGPIVAYMVDLKIQCRECGQDFAFFGLPNGLSFYQPTVSIDGTEAHLPLVIPGTEPPAGLAGFRVTHQVFDEREAVKQ